MNGTNDGGATPAGALLGGTITVGSVLPQGPAEGPAVFGPPILLRPTFSLALLGAQTVEDAITALKNAAAGFVNSSDPTEPHRHSRRADRALMPLTLSVRGLRRALGISLREDHRIVNEVKPEVIAPPIRDASELLERALGASLRDLAEASRSKASARIAPGVVGRSYPSAFHAGVDSVRAHLEMEREILGDKIRRTEADARSFGAGENESMLQADRAAWAALDERIATIQSLGVPLAWRAHLLDLLAIAEADFERARAEHAATLPGYHWGREEIADDDVLAWGEAAARRRAVCAEDDARRALRAAHSDLIDAQIAVQRWRVTNAKIAQSIGEGATQ